jgi:tripartite-type tricarboxylate transporter receptor subunit TctC
MPFDPQRDLQPIVLVGKNPLLFLVNENVPARNLAEFVAFARTKNGKVNYATPGAASQAHLIVEMWSARAGIKMQQIPYRGGAPAVLATATGETQFTLMSPLVAMSQIEAKKLRPLATGSPVRDAQFPDLPTLAEAGYPGIEAVQWFGLLTTAGTPKDVVERLNAEVNKALRDPELQKSFSAQGVSTAGGTAEEFASLIATELRNWRETAEKANIKAE